MIIQLVIFLLSLTINFSAAKTINLGQTLGPAVELYENHRKVKKPLGLHDQDKFLELSQSYYRQGVLIELGDELVFSDGSRFRVEEYLGGERSASVWRTADGFALRIPAFIDLDTKTENDIEDALFAARVYLQGQQQMQELIGADYVAKVYSGDRIEYTLVQLVRHSRHDPSIEFYQFLESYKASGFQMQTHRGVSVDRLLKGLEDLAANMWRLVQIPEGFQMLWSGSRWVFTDFSGGNQVWSPGTKAKTVFTPSEKWNNNPAEDQGSFQPRELFQKLEGLVLKSRDCSERLSVR